jgi:MFS family permease
VSAGVAPSRARAAWVLAVLFAVYVLNFVDRQILAIVIDDIKREIALSDAQLGLLLGPAFVLFYTLAGIPIARLADRTSRRAVIAAGLVLWSAMTAACGLARSFGALALARFGVGVGEAAGTPPSHALLSDCYPPERRATALALYGMGIYVGVLFGFLGGGLVRDAFDWRTAFFAAGLPGIPLALLLLATVPEPPRGAAERGPVDTATPPLREVLRALFAQRSFVLLTLAGACQAVSGYAVLSWGPAFLGRVHGMTATGIGLRFGVLAGVGGALGVTAGGWLADRLAARDARWYAWLSAAVSLAAAPFAAVFYLAGDAAAALAAFAPFYVLNNMYVGPLWSLAQGLVKVRMRAVASATLLAVLNLVGLGLAQPLVGWLSDSLAPAHGPASLRYALLATAAVGALAAVFFAACARTLRRDLARAAA